MKSIAIYAAGTLLMIFAAVLILSGHPACTITGLLFAYALYISGCTKYGRKFWRAWHKVNLTIVKTYSE